MLKRILSAFKRRGVLALDYGRIALRNPKLFMTAAKHWINRRKRIMMGALNATADSRIIGTEQTDPVPAEALISGLADIMGVVDFGRTASGASIGVAEVNFLSALMFLRHQAYGPTMAVNGKQIHFGAMDFNRFALLRAQTIELTFVAPNLDRDVISIEAFFLRASGQWVSNNESNHQARALRSDFLTQTGLTDVRDILGGPTLLRKCEDRKIDAVYTWVNHNDPDWAALYAKHGGMVETATDAAALSRFHSNDELRYSLRSVAQNAPWVNRIFVLTNCARPDWLHDDPRLVWVDHSGVIPADCLPTFNSHVIESCLHLIPELSEHFLYLNDDVFLAQPMDKAFFFDEVGASSSFLESYGMVSGPVTEGDPDYLNASRNVAQILHAKLGFLPTQLHQHTAFALRRSILAEIETHWQDQFDSFRKNKFRTASDLNVASFLYHHYAIATGRARRGVVRNAFVKSMDMRWRDKLKLAAAPAYDTLCINEGGSDGPADDWHPTVQRFLSARFPQKAPWEK